MSETKFALASGGTGSRRAIPIWRGLIAALLVGVPSQPAFGCSMPSGASLLSNAEVVRSAKAKITRSDAIIDALVVRNARGDPILKPITVWKGTPRRTYRIVGDGCATFLPPSGGKVRVLLERVEEGWMVIGSDPEGPSTTIRFDDVLDRHLGRRRPPGFSSIDPMHLLRS